MQRRILTTLIAALFITAPAFAAVKHPLEGVWIVQSAEFQGKEVDVLKGKTMEFRGGKFIMEFGGKKQTNTYRIDDSKTPKQFDVVAKGPGTLEMVSLAIYKIEGETLTICTGGGSAETTAVAGTPREKPPETVYKSDPRPTAFDSSKAALMVLKRKK